MTRSAISAYSNRTKFRLNSKVFPYSYGGLVEVLDYRHGGLDDTALHTVT